MGCAGGRHARIRCESPQPGSVVTVELRELAVTPYQHVHLGRVVGEEHRGLSSPLARKIVARWSIAGDERDAKVTVTRLLDDFGFDTSTRGPLKEDWRIQRDTLGSGPRRTADELRRNLAAAKRYADQSRLSGANHQGPPRGQRPVIRRVVARIDSVRPWCPGCAPEWQLRVVDIMPPQPGLTCLSHAYMLTTCRR